jgi:hypothetical protein
MLRVCFVLAFSSPAPELANQISLSTEPGQKRGNLVNALLRGTTVCYGSPLKLIEWQVIQLARHSITFTILSPVLKDNLERELHLSTPLLAQVLSKIVLIVDVAVGEGTVDVVQNVIS